MKKSIIKLCGKINKKTVTIIELFILLSFNPFLRKPEIMKPYFTRNWSKMVRAWHIQLCWKSMKICTDLSK